MTIYFASPISALIPLWQPILILYILYIIFGAPAAHQANYTDYKHTQILQKKKPKFQTWKLRALSGVLPQLACRTLARLKESILCEKETGEK